MYNVNTRNVSESRILPLIPLISLPQVSLYGRKGASAAPRNPVPALAVFEASNVGPFIWGGSDVASFLHSTVEPSQNPGSATGNQRNFTAKDSAAVHRRRTAETILIRPIRYTCIGESRQRAPPNMPRYTSGTGVCADTHQHRYTAVMFHTVYLQRWCKTETQHLIIQLLPRLTAAAF